MKVASGLRTTNLTTYKAARYIYIYIYIYDIYIYIYMTLNEFGGLNKRSAYNEIKN